ncbi:MAG: porin [Desulfurivibrio sp.]|nr:porin [Desulfurivibrio sp.]
MGKHKWWATLAGSTALLLVGVSGAPAMELVAAEGYSFELYGSARLQGEAVRPDDRDALDSYTGFRDAYSRIGAKGDYQLDHGLTLFGQLELPVDLANGEIQDPYNHHQDVRVAKAGLRGDFGSLAFGRMWTPYYNAIAYPVDMFNSYYSGFATYSTSRESQTFSYYSPDINDFSFALGWAVNNEYWYDDGKDRFQATASYNLTADTTVAAGLDHLSSDQRLWGLSLMHNWEQLYIGAKLEVHDSDYDTGYGADGETAVNLYAAYTLGQQTYKAMLAEVENYGETVFHLGVDHQFNKRLKFFAEYYREQDSAAITTERGSGDGTWLNDFGGGEVFLLGARFDF